MKVVLAEKPSVARDLAAFLGAKGRHDGYFEGNGYQVTWAFGHLVTLKEPSEYDSAFKKWSLATLPIVPSSFQLKLITNPGVSKQFNVIKKLIAASTGLICATDAGREGELIFRYILSLAGEEKRSFQRLWLSSLTDEAIGKAFKQIKEGSEYDKLYAAAKCRSESDWIVGLNATRNFTVRYGGGEILWSVGRVQTPVLAMLVGRDDEIRSFISVPFWELRTTYKAVVFRHKGERCKTEDEGKELLQKVEGHPFEVSKVSSKEEKLLPPFLYDLTELQRDMNKRHGISANETLAAAQKLYESKLISYPRTDSKYLSTDMKKEIPKILEQLQRKEVEKLDLQALPFTSRIINNAKTGEHHAIIPTGKRSGSLPDPMQNVFDAIVVRFIAAFYPTCLKGVTTILGTSNKEQFQAKGTRILEPGWTVLYGKEEEEEELPEFTPKETGEHKPFVKQGKTEPPKHFTEGALLSAMETAGRLVEDEELKDALKQKGLGTPATRAAIIETLLKRGYIQREKKLLKATDLGRYLIALIQDSALKSPELTGEWESKLKEMEQGSVDAVKFMDEIVGFTKDLIHRSDSSRIDDRHLGPCPRCKKPMIEGRKGYGCSAWKEGCSFVIWKEYKGKSLGLHQAKQLIQRKIIPHPIDLASGQVILYLSGNGSLMEIPMPKGPEKKKYRPKKRS